MSVIEVEFRVLVEFIEVMLVIVDNCVFSGVVIVEVMVFGDVLGRLVLMLMVGKLMFGNLFIGNCG